MYIRTVEYYSALQRKEIWIHAIAWANLEDIVLNEINQVQRDKYYIIPVI